MTERWKNKEGEERSETTWIRVVCWGYLAETMSRILQKGDLVHVSGKLSSRQYEKDGQKINVVEVKAADVLRFPSNKATVYESAGEDVSRDDGSELGISLDDE